MEKGIIMSLNFRDSREAELFTNAVKKVNGKIINSMRSNLFNVIALSILILNIKSINNSSEIEKKNTFCTTSISYARTEYVIGDRNVNPNNTLSPIFVFFFAIESEFHIC
ncbi:MAG: hypothetical protein A2W30_02150 [Ignavibacteria bacterium RBG_16_36_9]|nr:MAG: hypothetical protein A2W30_02150 [Ignavibacteria bacterium RBG_16_36_9]